MTDADDIENAACKTIDQYLASVTYPVIQEQRASSFPNHDPPRRSVISQLQPCMTG
jgi:hypothetical protein